MLTDRRIGRRICGGSDGHTFSSRHVLICSDIQSASQSDGHTVWQGSYHADRRTDGGADAAEQRMGLHSPEMNSDLTLNG